MANNSKKYWKNRSEKIANKNIKDINDFEKRIQKEYEKQIKYIDDEINLFMAKHVTNGKLDYAKAMKKATKEELKDLKNEIDKFKKVYKNIDNDELQKQIAILSNNRSFTRFQVMKDKIQMKMGEISVSQIDNVEKFLSNQYLETYSETNNIFSDYFNIKNAFETPSLDKIAPIIQYPYTGVLFSERIWKANDKLISNVIVTLTKGMVQGK